MIDLCCIQQYSINYKIKGPFVGVRNGAVGGLKDGREMLMICSRVLQHYVGDTSYAGSLAA